MVDIRSSMETVKLITSNYTPKITDNTIFLDSSGWAFTITLPLASTGFYLFRFKFVNIGNIITFAPSGGDSIPGLTNIDWKTYILQSDGISKWSIVWDDTIFGDTAWTAIEGNDPRIWLVSWVSYKNANIADINQTTRTSMSWDLATETNTNPTKFTAWVSGITVIEDGDYKVCSSIFLIGGTNNQRKSVNLKIEINWITTTVQSQWYIRMAQWANECSAYIEEIINLTAWDVINISWLRAAWTWVAQCPVGSSVLSVFKLK